jgi:TalC/MipB family fructose-6-phosphate aldolase
MFIDTANINEIKEALKTGIIRGVTTNPTILRKENKPRLNQLDDILELEPGMIFVQVVGRDTEELYEDYLKLHDYGISKGKGIGIKTPMSFMGLELVRRIKEHDPKTVILGTAIYSADQAILSSIAGCDYLAPYVNRIKNCGLNPYEEISRMRSFIDDRGLTTKILAASFKEASQVTDALNAGAHTCTAPLSIFKLMMDKDAALSAIEVFNCDGEAIG